MSRFQNENRPKAVWTLIHEVTVNGMKRSFYFSDGGAVKITRHTDKGEVPVLIMPCANLEDLSLLSPEFGRVYEAFQSVADDIQKSKLAKKETIKIEKQRQAEISKVERTMQAATDALLMATKRLEDLKANPAKKTA